MLIKRSIVERWYLTTSPIYKNFAYLFQNPLWNRGIPSGFSVCPYFWLSIFSLFIFRPFAMVASRILIPATRITVNKLGPPTRIGAAVIFVLSLLSLSGYEVYRFYKNEVSPNPEAILTFWSVLSFAVLAFASLIHDDAGKCRWASYVWLWAAVTLGACFYWFRPGLLLEWKFTIGLIMEVADLFWFGVQAAAHWMWIALIWSGRVLWKAASWQPYVRYVPWYIYPAIAVGAMTALVWITDRLTRNPKPKAGKPADYYNQWETYLIWQLKRWPLPAYIEVEWKDCSSESIPFGFHTAVIRRLINPIVCDLRLINPPVGLWVGKKRYRDMDDIRCGLEDSLKLVGKANLASIVDWTHLREVVAAELKEPWVKDAIAKAKAERAKEAASKRQWADHWENSRLRKACITFTTGLRTTGEFVVATPFRATWHIIKALGMGLATFFAYLWMIAVAKKKGACPYFTFRDK